MEDDNSVNTKPYKVKDVSRANCKGVVAASLDEVKAKAAEKFGQSDVPNIHLDSDGTEIDDEDYFQTLEPNTELVAVFNNEQWIDPTHYVTITTRRNSADTTDSPEVERVHLKKIVSQLKNNLYNVSVLSEPDLEMITNMDPNSVADITGKDFIEQLKEVSGRFLHEKREALDAIELLKLFAKHKGLSIEIAADEDASNQLRTTISTDNFDEDAANCDDIHAESITLTSIIDETMARTTKDIHHHNVIETQPPASQTANNQLPNPATDKLLIEQATPISMKKSTADI